MHKKMVWVVKFGNPNLKEFHHPDKPDMRIVGMLCNTIGDIAYNDYNLEFFKKKGADYYFLGAALSDGCITYSSRKTAMAAAKRFRRINRFWKFHAMKYEKCLCISDLEVSCNKE